MALSTRIGRIEIIAICDFIPPPAPPAEPSPAVPVESVSQSRESQRPE